MVFKGRVFVSVRITKMERWVCVVKGLGVYSICQCFCRIEGGPDQPKGPVGGVSVRFKRTVSTKKKRTVPLAIYINNNIRK